MNQCELCGQTVPMTDIDGEMNHKNCGGKVKAKKLEGNKHEQS